MPGLGTAGEGEGQVTSQVPSTSKFLSIASGESESESGYPIARRKWLAKKRLALSEGHIIKAQ